MPCLKSVTIFFLSNVPCFSVVLYQYSKISILHNSVEQCSKQIPPQPLANILPHPAKACFVFI